MKYYNFRVDAFFPPEYSQQYNEIIEKERKKQGIDIIHKFEESAPPPELIKDIIIITSATLNIISLLIGFIKMINNDKSKIYITSNGDRFDLEASNVDEIKVKLGEPTIKRYKIEITFPDIPLDIVDKMARTLSFRPIYYNGKQLSPNSHVLFADYDEDSKSVKASIQISDKEINDLLEKGSAMYAFAKPHKLYEGEPAEKVILTSLTLTLEEISSSSKLEAEEL